MFRFRWVVLAACSAVFSVGCGGSKVAELTAEVQQLKSRVADLEAERVAMETELSAAQADLARMEEIRTGYETARVEFQKNLAQLAPVLGLTGSPLPPFEQLSDSSWVDRFAPSGDLTTGLKDLKDLEQQFRGLLEAAGEGLPELKPPADD